MTDKESKSGVDDRIIDEVDVRLRNIERKEALENFINIYHKYGCTDCPFYETCIELIDRSARYKGPDYDDPYVHIGASYSSICLIVRKMIKQLEGDTYGTCAECKHCGSKQVYKSSHIRWNCLGYHIYPVERFTLKCNRFKPDSENQHKYPAPEPEPPYVPMKPVWVEEFEVMREFHIKMNILEGMQLLDKLCEEYNDSFKKRRNQRRQDT